MIMLSVPQQCQLKASALLTSQVPTCVSQNKNQIKQEVQKDILFP